MITEEPAATAVMTPVDEFTVATAVVPDVHAPPVLPLLVKVVVPLEQMACVPLSVPALGVAVTVTVLVAVALLQPPVPVTVYVITEEPAATAVMTPVEEFTVAFDGVADVHAPPELPLLANVVVPFEQMAWVPLSMPALGAAVTVTILVVIASLQPPVPVTV